MGIDRFRILKHRFRRTAQRNWKSARTTGIHIKFDKNEVLYKITVDKSTNQRADSLYSHLSRALEVFEVDEDDARMKVLFANTSLSKANNQVFIVTRLPRADLDSLLATDAK